MCFYNKIIFTSMWHCFLSFFPFILFHALFHLHGTRLANVCDCQVLCARQLDGTQLDGTTSGSPASEGAAASHAAAPRRGQSARTGQCPRQNPVRKGGRVRRQAGPPTSAPSRTTAPTGMVDGEVLQRCASSSAAGAWRLQWRTRDRLRCLRCRKDKTY